MTPIPKILPVILFIFSFFEPLPFQREPLSPLRLAKFLDVFYILKQHQLFVANGIKSWINILVWVYNSYRTICILPNGFISVLDVFPYIVYEYPNPTRTTTEKPYWKLIVLLRPLISPYIEFTVLNKVFCPCYSFNIRSQFQSTTD